MDIIISNSDKRPIYKQIEDQIKSEIIKENIKEGDTLPSLRVLARDLKVSMITTKKAYEELEKSGFIVTVPGKGTFVAKTDVKEIQNKQITSLEEVLREVVTISKTNNITLEYLIKILSNIYKED